MSVFICTLWICGWTTAIGVQIVYTHSSILSVVLGAIGIMVGIIVPLYYIHKHHEM